MQMVKLFASCIQAYSLHVIVGAFFDEVSLREQKDVLFVKFDFLHFKL